MVRYFFFVSLKYSLISMNCLLEEFYSEFELILSLELKL